jgi:hypothetical protein
MIPTVYNFVGISILECIDHVMTDTQDSRLEKVSLGRLSRHEYRRFLEIDISNFY